MNFIKVACFAWLLACNCFGASYYVAQTATGDGSGSGTGLLRATRFTWWGLSPAFE